MVEIPRGPEDVPLRAYIKDMPLVILIKDIKSNRVIREEKINYSEPEARKWLGKITYWACTNQYSVETLSEKDYNKE